MTLEGKTVSKLNSVIPTSFVYHFPVIFWFYHLTDQIASCEHIQAKIVTVHSVLSNVAKIHSRLPVAMEFWLVCLGILAYSCQNTSRDNDMWTVTQNSLQIALFCGIAIEPKETKETTCLFWSLFCLFKKNYSNFIRFL